MITLFTATAAAQSLEDMAREERQKKAAAQSAGESRKVFSNIDNAPAQAITSDGKVARHRTQDSALQIDAPGDGDVFNPGQTVHVTSATISSWQFVGILAAIPDVPAGVATLLKLTISELRKPFRPAFI